MQFYRLSLQVCHLEYWKDGSEWNKGTERYTNLGDQEPFMGEETGKTWVVISLVKEQCRRDAFTVCE